MGGFSKNLQIQFNWKWNCGSCKISDIFRNNSIFNFQQPSSICYIKNLFLTEFSTKTALTSNLLTEIFIALQQSSTVIKIFHLNKNLLKKTRHLFSYIIDFLHEIKNRKILEYIQLKTKSVNREKSRKEKKNLLWKCV